MQPPYTPHLPPLQDECPLTTVELPPETIAQIEAVLGPAYQEYLTAGGKPITHGVMAAPVDLQPNTNPLAVLTYWDDFKARLAELGCTDEPDDTRPKAVVTFLDNEGGKSLTKKFSLGENGKISKETAGQLVRGVATRHALTIGEFADALDNLKHSRAAFYGEFDEDKVAVRTKNAIQHWGRKSRIDNLPVRTRSRADVSFSNGPSWFFLDVDKPDGFAPLRWGNVIDILQEVMPELLAAPHIVTNSASSYIYSTETGKRLIGRGGMHFYFMVGDGTDIPRLGKILQHRLWLAGYGYFKINSAGQLLRRSPFDGAVHQPERIDFAAGAKCDAGLKQCRSPAITMNDDGEPLDTSSIPDLTDYELNEYRRIEAELRAEKEPEAAIVHAAWLDRKSEDYADTLKEPDPEKRAELIKKHRQRLELACDGGDLVGSYPILIVEPGHRYWVTVDEILGDKKKFNGKKTADPIEPEYDDGRDVGMLLLHAQRGPYVRNARNDAEHFLYTSSEPPAPTYTPDERAEATWEACKLVDDTPAEAHLREYLKLGNAPVPRCFRFLEEECALAIASTNTAGDIVHVELIALNDDGSRSRRKFGACWEGLGRCTVGYALAGAVRMSGADPRLCACVRLGDAIAAYLAGFSAIVAGTSFARLDSAIERGRPVALCRAVEQSEAVRSAGDRGVKRLASRMRAHGHHVAIVYPTDYERGVRGLFDLIQPAKSDPAALVRERIGKFLGPARPVDLGLESLRASRDRSYSELRKMIVQLARGETGDKKMPVMLHREPPGHGKSERYRRCLPAAAAELESRGALFNKDYKIGIAVPYHDLGNETVDYEYRAEGEAADEAAAALNAEIPDFAAAYRSRHAYQRDSDERMCAELDTIDKAMAAGVPNLALAVCKKCVRNAVGACPWWDQAERLAAARAVVYAHANLWREPHGMLGDIQLNLIDENPVRGAFCDPDDIRVDDLIDPDAMPFANSTHGDNRHALFNALHECLLERHVGPAKVRQSILRKHGLDANTAESCIDHEFNRTIYVRDADEEKEWGKCRPNHSVGPARRMWRCLWRLLKSDYDDSEWLILYRNDNGELRLYVRGMRELHPSLRVPTIIFDGTANEKLLRKLFWGVEVGRDVKVEMPHARIYQIEGRSFAKSSHVPTTKEPRTKKEKDEEARKAKLRENMAVFTATLQRVYPGKQMFASNIGTEEAFDDKGRDGVLTGHFGALVGRNDFRDCVTAFIAGRGGVPSVDRLEEMAMALSGRTIEPVGDNFPEHDSTRLVRASDGSFHEVPCRAPYHPDTMVQLLLEEYGHAEVAQAGHRLRPINRGPNDPAVIVFGSDLELRRMPIDGIISSHEFDNPSLRDRMLAEGGIAFKDAAHAAAYYPEMFGSTTAAKQAFEAEKDTAVLELRQVRRKVSLPRNMSFTGESYQPLDLSQPERDNNRQPLSAATITTVSFANRPEGVKRASFQLAGAGRKRCEIEFDPNRIKDLKQRLTEKFGPLAHFEIEGDTPASTAKQKENAPMNRADYEANSAARQKPWEAEGIDRATYYRRLKRQAAEAAKQAEEQPEEPEPQAALHTLSQAPDGSWRCQVFEDCVLRESFMVSRRKEPGKAL